MVGTTKTRINRHRVKSIGAIACSVMLLAACTSGSERETDPSASSSESAQPTVSGEVEADADIVADRVKPEKIRVR